MATIKKLQNCIHVDVDVDVDIDVNIDVDLMKILLYYTLLSLQYIIKLA